MAKKLFNKKNKATSLLFIFGIILGFWVWLTWRQVANFFGEGPQVWVVTTILLFGFALLFGFGIKKIVGRFMP